MNDDATTPAPSDPVAGPVQRKLGLEPALMTALRHAWEGNHKAAEAYALLAADNLEKRGEANYAKYLRMAVDEMTGRKPAVRVHTNKA